MNHKIEFDDEFKLLGVMIDNKLTFVSYIDNIAYKVSSKTKILIKNFKAFPLLLS